jgi:hypothetical protein
MNRPIKIAVLDMYNGEANQGMRCIFDIINRFNQLVTFQVFDVRGKREIPDINKFDMGDNIYLSPLLETINNVGGVLNVIDIRVYNKIGEGKYSLNEISQPYIDTLTRQIDISEDYTIFGEPTSMFEIKFPNMDIMVRVK